MDRQLKHDSHFGTDEDKRQLERLERQLIPLLNSVRQALGKPPVIVPKPKGNSLTTSDTIDNVQESD